MATAQPYLLLTTIPPLTIIIPPANQGYEDGAWPRVGADCLALPPLDNNHSLELSLEFSLEQSLGIHLKWLSLKNISGTVSGTITGFISETVSETITGTVSGILSGTVSKRHLELSLEHIIIWNCLSNFT